MTATIPVLTFSVCDQTYAISIVDVVEVAAMVETASMGDDAGPMIHGVVIRRGEPMLLVDLRHVFYCADALVTLDTLFVVVREDSNKDLVGFIVDRVHGVVYLNSEQIRPVQGARGYVRGIVAHEQKLIQWIDVKTVLAQTLPGSIET